MRATGSTLKRKPPGDPRSVRKPENVQFTPGRRDVIGDPDLEYVLRGVFDQPYDAL